MTAKDIDNSSSNKIFSSCKASWEHLFCFTFFMITHLGKLGEHVDTFRLIHDTSVNIGVNSEQFACKTGLPENSTLDSQMLYKYPI